MQLFQTTNIPLEPVKHLESPFLRQSLVKNTKDGKEIGTQTPQRDTQKHITIIKKLNSQVKILEEIIDSKSRQVENLTRIIKSIKN